MFTKDVLRALDKCFTSHFSSHLGKIISRESFEQNKQTPSIDIIGCDNVYGGCRAFCSVGLSSYEDIVGQYAEIFMPVDNGWNETPQILASTLFNIIQSNKRIGWGFSMRFANVFPDFVEAYGKSAIYFTLPFDVPHGFTKVNCGKKIGHVYLACYISEAEHQFFVREGTEQFDSLLEEKKVDIFNITRPSAI